MHRMWAPARVLARSASLPACPAARCQACYIHPVHSLLQHSSCIALPAFAPQVSLADAEKRAKELSFQVKMLADVAGSPGALLLLLLLLQVLCCCCCCCCRRSAAAVAAAAAGALLLLLLQARCCGIKALAARSLRPPSGARRLPL